MTKIPFGKYRGKELTDIPKDYLLWLTDPKTKSGVFKVDPAIQEEARRLLEVNHAQYQPPSEGELQKIMDKPTLGLDKAQMIKILQDIERYVKDKISDVAQM